MKTNNMKRLLLTVMMMGAAWAASYAGNDKVARLATLDLAKAQQPYGMVIAGKGFDGQAPTVAQAACKDVVCVHAPSRIRIALGRAAKTFVGYIGVADNAIDYTLDAITSTPLVDGKRLFYCKKGEHRTFVGIEGKDGRVDRGQVTFCIIGDGKTLYSRRMRQGDALQQVRVALDGVSVLELVVDEGGDGPSGDFAYWSEAAIAYGDKAPRTLGNDETVEAATMAVATEQRLRAKIGQMKKASLPLPQPGYDWLIHTREAKAEVLATPDGKGVVMTNGLVARIFRVVPNLATIDLVNQMTNTNMLRAVSNEGTITIDGQTYTLGGLEGQEERGYLMYDWIDGMTPIANAFMVEDMTLDTVGETLPWARKRWALRKESPTGQSVVFTLRGRGALRDVVVRLRYDLYDGIPTIRKGMEVVNEGNHTIRLNSFKLEQLCFAEPESPVGGAPSRFELPNICIESNYQFGAGTMFQKESNQTVKWVRDTAYTSQCNFMLKTPCIMEVALPVGPDMPIAPGDTYTAMDVYEIPYDSYDKERKGLFKRRFYRTVAPWLTENPIFLHLISMDPEVVRRAIDQCAECGYEMVILSFGCGLDMESDDPQQVALAKSFADYAHSKGIEIGGYSLLSSRWISDEVDVINPKTGKRGGMIFGSSPCLCSEWGYDYFDKIRRFYEQTGFDVFEHDGSYAGNVCASTRHKYHQGLNDSQWRQWLQITDLYKWMCGKGIYTNVPDYYFLNGSSKISIGYRETNWSLPRDRQLILGRQINYAGTYDRLASSCWTFVPLTQYHGGGAAATLEPLSEHLAEYRQHMVQNYGAGIQACYRGPRLYDTEETRQMVKEVIDWYKRYRVILNSDIIHLRKADGRDWDGFLHVNPDGRERGLALFFNPTDRAMTRTVKLPLYYTGLTDRATISREGEAPRRYKLDRDYCVSLRVDIPARGYMWYVVQ